MNKSGMPAATTAYAAAIQAMNVKAPATLAIYQCVDHGE